MGEDLMQYFIIDYILYVLIIGLKTYLYYILTMSGMTQPNKTLEEMIKLLPDDMIREIKGYVINPYKFIAEVKLYKSPTYFYRKSRIDDNMVLESINRSRVFDWSYFRDVNHSIFESNYLFDLLHNIRYGGLDYNQLKEVLKNLKIKGRTKLILWKTHGNNPVVRNKAIVQAILKSNN